MGASVRTRVLLVESQALVREGLQCLLESEFRVVRAAAGLDEAREEARRLRPDVVVLGFWRSPVVDLEWLQGLREVVPGVSVVVVGPDAPELAAQTLALGVSGWVARSSTPRELREAVRAAAQGRRYLTRRVAGGRVDQLPWSATQPPSSEATPRGLDVVRRLAEGKLMKQVAAELGITPRTVAFHKYRTMRALGIDSNAGLVRYAVQNQLL